MLEGRKNKKVFFLSETNLWKKFTFLAIGVEWHKKIINFIASCEEVMRKICYLEVFLARK